MDTSAIQSAFSRTYSEGRWKHSTSESLSGEGSGLKWTESYRDELISIIKNHNIKSILDCSCGDWNWMRTISDQFDRYVGIDIVASVIQSNTERYATDKVSFINNDMLSYLVHSELFDLIICRHTFEHLPEAYNIKSINQIMSKGRFFLTTTMVADSNMDKECDGWGFRRIDLSKEPYQSIVGTPIYSFYDSPIDLPR